MSSYQKIIIEGNLGGDPESRQTQNGKLVASFSVAVNEKRGGTDHTEWFRCVAWEKTGEVARDYLRKGDCVLLEGRLQTRDWTDKDGQTRKSTELVVDRLVLQGRKDAQAPGAPPQSRPAAPAGRSAPGRGQPPAPAAPPPAPEAVAWDDSDIPF